METRSIIEAIQNDNSKKLIQILYKVALPPIIKHVKQKRGTVADAEDCFQEAVLSLVKKVKESSFDEQYEVKNFLFIAARNCWYNKLKRSGRVVAADLEEYQVEDTATGAEQLMIDDERTVAINALLNNAGERCKELLKLIIFENKKMKEVVELMGFSSVEVVKTNHYRCKKKLKEVLKGNNQLLMALKG